HIPAGPSATARGPDRSGEHYERSGLCQPAGQFHFRHVRTDYGYCGGDGSYECRIPGTAGTSGCARQLLSVLQTGAGLTAAPKVSPQGLNPGDRVVDLAALGRSVAVLTGAIAAAWIAWSTVTNWPMRLWVLVIGAALGYVVGQVVSRVRYRRHGTHTTVVKVGWPSLAAKITRHRG